MKRIIALALLSLLLVELGHLTFRSPAAAAALEPLPTPVQTVIITIEATPAHSQAHMQRPQAVIYDYRVGRDHIEAVARGMWGLNTSTEKRGFAFVIANRTMCQRLRADGKREFANSIKGNVEQPGEFFFYNADAPVTEENYELAELYINAQLTYLMTKKYTGYAFPSTMLFMNWDGESLSFAAEVDGEPWYYGV